jgi:flagellar biosynthetic protein FlhB
MAEKDADNSESATPYKLEEARKKGTVAKSVDFISVAAMAVLVGALYANGWDAVKQSVRLMQTTLIQGMKTNWGADWIANWTSQLLITTLHILSPLFLSLVIAAILVGLFQTGVIFTVKPLKPDLNRISPMAGIKRIFSLRTIYESIKSVIKIVVLGAVTYFAIVDLIPGLLKLSSLDSKGYLQSLIKLTGGILVKIIIVLIIIAVIDFTYTRWEFAKRMRMSKRDVKDESKQREGDPRIRQRIRELQREVLKRSKAARQVSSADVLITNPTHIAVALRYQHGDASAPQVTAKGAGELARKMRLTASRHNVPIVQNRELARILFKEVDFEGYVPEKLYPQLAKIMVWVYAMREARYAKGRTA